MGEGNLKWRRGREILARCYQEWSKLYVCLQEEDERSRVHGWDEAALHHSGVLTVLSDPRTGLWTLRPHSHLLMSNPPTQRSLQANHRLRGQKYS